MSYCLSIPPGRVLSTPRKLSPARPLWGPSEAPLRLSLHRPHWGFHHPLLSLSLHRPRWGFHHPLLSLGTPFAAPQTVRGRLCFFIIALECHWFMSIKGSQVFGLSTASFPITSISLIIRSFPVTRIFHLTHERYLLTSTHLQNLWMTMYWSVNHSFFSWLSARFTSLVIPSIWGKSLFIFISTKAWCTHYIHL